MKNRIIILLASLFSLTAPSAPAVAGPLSEDEALNLYAEGNLLYQREKYEEAIACYRQLLEQPYEAWEVYYNLGNAYVRTGAYSQAILAYERAERLHPGQADIRHNLALCRTKITDEREAMPTFFLQDAWRGLVLMMSANAWAILLLVLSAGLLASLICFFLGRRYELRRAAFYSTAVWGVATCIVLMACISSRKMRFKNEAIIMVPQTEIKARPEANAETRYLLHEGNKVEILDEIAPYYKIKMCDGNQGWISATALERI